MRVQLRATGLLYEYVPGASAPGQACTLECPTGCTAAALVERLGVPSGEAWLLSRNGDLLGEPATARLHEGDRLVLMAPLTAG